MEMYLEFISLQTYNFYELDAHSVRLPLWGHANTCTEKKKAYK